MLGTRGVRLGDPAPGALRDAGPGDLFARRAPSGRTGSADVEMMVPLVAYERELELDARADRAVAEESGHRRT